MRLQDVKITFLVVLFIAPLRLKCQKYSEQCCIYVQSSGVTTSKGQADQTQEKAGDDTLGVMQAEVTMVDLAGVHTNDHPVSHTVPRQ